MDSLDEMIRQAKTNSRQEKPDAFFKIVEYFVSTQGIRGKSKITPAQRNMIHMYDLMHKKHPTWGLNAAAENLATLFISEGGESRRGIIDLFRGLLSQMREESLSVETGTDAMKK